MSFFFRGEVNEMVKPTHFDATGWVVLSRRLFIQELFS